MKKSYLKPNRPNLVNAAVITVVAILSAVAVTQSMMLPTHSAFAEKEQSSGHDKDCQQEGPGHVDHDKDRCDRNGNDKDREDNHEQEDEGDNKENSNDQ